MNHFLTSSPKQHSNCRLQRNILADKPRVTKFPIEWEEVKEETMGDQEGEEQDGGQGIQGGEVAMGHMGGIAPPIAAGGGDMDMDG